MKFVHKQYKPAIDLKPFDVVVGNKSYGNYHHPKIVLSNKPSMLVDYVDILFYDFENDSVKTFNFYRMKFFSGQI